MTYESLLPINVKYTLKALHKSEFRPAVINSSSVVYNRQFASKSSPRDDSWLVVRMEGVEFLDLLQLEQEDEEIGRSYVESILPTHLHSQAKLLRGNVSLSLEGMMVVGTQTGVVLDGMSTISATMKYEIVFDGSPEVVTFTQVAESRDSLRGTVKRSIPISATSK